MSLETNGSLRLLCRNKLVSGLGGKPHLTSLQAYKRTTLIRSGQQWQGVSWSSQLFENGTGPVVIFTFGNRIQCLRRFLVKLKRNEVGFYIRLKVSVSAIKPRQCIDSQNRSTTSSGSTVEADGLHIRRNNRDFVCSLCQDSENRVTFFSSCSSGLGVSRSLFSSHHLGRSFSCAKRLACVMCTVVEIHEWTGRISCNLKLEREYCCL